MVRCNNLISVVKIQILFDLTRFRKEFYLIIFILQASHRNKPSCEIPELDQLTGQDCDGIISENRQLRAQWVQCFFFFRQKKKSPTQINGFELWRLDKYFQCHMEIFNKLNGNVANGWYFKAIATCYRSGRRARILSRLEAKNDIYFFYIFLFLFLFFFF